MAKKYSKYSNLSKRDRFQIASFKLIFTGMVRNKYTVEEALARGIELTSDEKIDAIIKADPGIVEKWFILNKEGANKREQSKKSKKEADGVSRTKNKKDSPQVQKGQASQYRNFEYGRQV